MCYKLIDVCAYFNITLRRVSMGNVSVSHSCSFCLWKQVIQLYYIISQLATLLALDQHSVSQKPTSSTVRLGRCSIPSKSFSFTGGDKLEKHKRILSITDTVRSEAILEGAHSSSVEPSLLWSHRPVSLSFIDAILEKKCCEFGHFNRLPKKT